MRPKINIPDSFIQNYNQQKESGPAVPDSIIESYNSGKTTGVTTDESAQIISKQIDTATADENLAEIDRAENMSDFEKDWLKKSYTLVGQKMPNGEDFTVDKWHEAKQVLNKEHPDFGNFLGGPSRTAYYWDKYGMPVPLKYGEKPPVDAQIQGVWGSQMQAEDDNPLTTFTKSIYNGFVDILKAPTALWSVAQGLVTGDESEIATTTNNTVDRLKFATRSDSHKNLVDEKAFTSLSEFFNSENWNPNPHNIVGMVGEGVGTLLQFVAGSGLAKGVTKGLSKEATDPSSWIKKNADLVANGSFISLNESLAAAERAGLEGREKFAFAATTAIGMGILEIGLGGLESDVLRLAGREAKQEITQAAVKKFVESGAELSAKTLKEAFDEVIKVGSEVLPAFIKQGGGEALEEASQAYWTALSADTYRMLGGETDFKSDLTSATTMRDAFEGSLVGFALGSGLSGFVNKDELQLDNAYQFIKSGKKEELIQNLHNLKEAKEISPIEYDTAIQKIDMYEGYIDQFKGKGLNPEEEKYAVDVLNKAENLEARINDLQQNDSISPINKEAEIKAYEKRKKQYVDELSNIYSGEWFKGKQKELAKEQEEIKQEEVKNEELVAENTSPVTETEKPLEDVNIEANPEIKEPEVKTSEEDDFKSFSEKETTGKKWKYIPDSKKADVMAKYLESKPSKKIKGVLELRDTPVYNPNKGKQGEKDKGEEVDFKAYDVVVGDKKFKISSRDFMRGFKEKNLVGREVEVSLFKPTDDELPANLKKNVVDGKFAFPGYKGTYPYILQVRDAKNDIVIGNVRVSDFTGKKKDRLPAEKEVKARPSVKSPKHTISVAKKNYSVDFKERKLIVKDEEDIEVKGPEKNTVLRKYEEEFDYSNGERIESFPSDIQSPEQVYEYVADNSKNPLEVIENYQLAKRNVPQTEYDYKEQIIAENINKIKKAGYIRFGDPNKITVAMSKSYFDKDGSNIDSLAQELSDMAGTEVTEQDIVDFIEKYPSVKEYYKSIDKMGEPDHIEALRGRFKVLTGLTMSERIISKALEQELENANIEYKQYLNQNFSDYESAITDYEKQIEEALSVTEYEDDGITYSSEQDQGDGEGGTKEGEGTIIQKQKSSDLESESLNELNDKIKKLKKALPGIEVIIDPDIDGAGQLDADGKTVRINPNYSKADTAIHEFGHTLIDILGGVENSFIKKGVDQLRSTQLWNEVADNYPELNEDVLEKEVLATAIGREGVGIWKEQKQKSAFRTWLDLFFNKIKKLLGIERNVARSLANQLLSGKKISGSIKATGETQKQKSSFIDRLLKSGENIIFNEKEHTYRYKDTELTSVTKLINDLEDYKYTGPEIEDIETRIKIGEDMDKTLQRIIAGASYDQLKSSSSLDETVFKSFYDEMNNFVTGLKRTGQLLSQVKVASLSNGRAGQIDILVYRPNGSVDIYDLKVSPSSVKSGSYKKAYWSNKSKMEKHGLQVATYANMIETGDYDIGIPKAKINSINIIPINIKIEEGKVVSAKREDTIKFNYDSLLNEVTRILPIQPSEITDRILNKEKKIINEKPISFRKWSRERGFDLDEADSRIDEIEEQLSEPLSKEEQNELNREMKELKDLITTYNDGHKQYLDDRKKILDLINSKGDVSNMNLDDLMETKALLSKYDDFKRSKLYGQIEFNIGQKLNAIRIEEIKDVDPNFDPSKETGGDLTKRDVFMQGLSTITQRFPAIQKFYKEYRKSYSLMADEFISLKNKAEELAKSVISEYNKNAGVGERAKNFVIGGGEKYFSYMAKDGKLVNSNDPEYNSLSKAQKDLLDFVNENKNKYAQYIGSDGNTLLKSGAGFIETLSKQGLFKAYANHLTKNYNLRNVKVKFKDSNTGVVSDVYFGDVENILNDYSKKNILTRANALYLITKYNIAARNGLSRKLHSDNTEIDLKVGSGRYYLSPDGNLVSMFSGQFKGDFTENYYETFMQYTKDALFVKHMNQMMPLLDGIEAFYKSFGNKTENVVKFLDVVKKGKFLGDIQETGAGKGFDAFLNLLRQWTSWRFLAFNIPANLWNVFIGKYNSFRSDWKNSAKGEKRMAESLLKGKENAKALNILKKFAPDIISDINRIDPEKHAGRFFDMFSFGGLRFGEAYIRGSAIVGKMTDEEYGWINDDGTIKGSDAEKTKREKILQNNILEYRSEVDRVQGRYSEVDRRNFSYFELGRFLGQFKVWMPEWVSERFSNKYIDADNNVREGSVTTLFNYGIKDLMKDITTKEFYSSDDIKHVNMRKNLRGAIITGGLFLIYLSMSDDDDDKEMANILGKALKDMAFIYRMDSASFLISQPAASMSTVVDFTKALHSAFTLQQYKKDGRFGDKGDLKAPGMFLNLVPGNKLIDRTMDILEE